MSGSLWKFHWLCVVQGQRIGNIDRWYISGIYMESIHTNLTALAAEPSHKLLCQANITTSMTLWLDIICPQCGSLSTHGPADQFPVQRSNKIPIRRVLLRRRAGKKLPYMHGPGPNPCVLTSRFATACAHHSPIESRWFIYFATMLQGHAARRLSQEYPALPNKVFVKIRKNQTCRMWLAKSICRASATVTFLWQFHQKLDLTHVQ